MKKTLASLIGLTLLGVSHSTLAAWPEKPVKFILAQAPGSGPDNVARLLADQLTRITGQAFIVDNKPGGQGLIGAQAAARSAADGYNYFLGTVAVLVTNPLLIKNMPYDPAKDFEPIAYVSSSPFAMFVQQDSPFKSVQEVVAHAKQSGGSFSIGHEGPRTFGGMIARLLNKRADAGANLVAFSSGPVGGLTNLVGGHVNSFITGIATGSELTKQGRLKVLAVTSPQPLADWPNVPTLSSSYPGFDLEGWQAMVAPAGTPPAAKQRLNELIRQVLAEPEVQSKLRAMGQQLAPDMSTEQLGAFLLQEQLKWAEIAKEVGVTPE
ncbi:MAG: tripartite tricarboxylate transporter substrate binding protein [Pigmentiphaga sp.]|nr:tripartite tricarboxylate transporter substrate binding protein [Pigmentiphaga sp.]